MMMRLAFARINQETNALSPVATTLADFESTHLIEGDALLEACAPHQVEAAGFLKNAELSGFVRACARQRGADVVVPVPLLSAWAVPGGPLTRACFDALVARLQARLRAAGDVDGVYLCLHGAMAAVGVDDAEAAIVRAVRDVVGVDMPLVVSYDLHANVTRAVTENVDALIAYATNPHRDHARTGAKAARILADAAGGRARPTMAWRSLPMLLGGGTTIDFVPPLLPIFLRMRALERSGAVLSASLLTCHPWNAHPETGWSVVVVTDGDRARAERIADDLAERAWRTRHAQPPPFSSAQDAVAAAWGARVRRRFGAVVLADASDVVSAGAPGESTELLRALVDGAQGLVCYAPIKDAAAVDALWASAPGDEVEVALGGKLDPARSRALAVTGVVGAKRHAHGVGRSVVLHVGTVRIVVVDGSALALKPSFYRDAGLAPWRADVIVVKNFFPFRIFFAALARKTIYVRTTGVTDFDAAFALPFAGPVHPRDVVDDWHEADRRRRCA